MLLRSQLQRLLELNRPLADGLRRLPRPFFQGPQQVCIGLLHLDEHCPRRQLAAVRLAEPLPAGQLIVFDVLAGQKRLQPPLHIEQANLPQDPLAAVANLAVRILAGGFQRGKRRQADPRQLFRRRFAQRELVAAQLQDQLGNPLRRQVRGLLVVRGCSRHRPGDKDSQSTKSQSPAKRIEIVHNLRL